MRRAVATLIIDVPDKMDKDTLDNFIRSSLTWYGKLMVTSPIRFIAVDMSVAEIEKEK